MADGGQAQDLVIHDVDAEMLALLKARASAHGIGIEEEVRLLLGRSLGQDIDDGDQRRKAESFLEDAARIRAMTPPERRRIDSTFLVREARDAGYWRDY